MGSRKRIRKNNANQKNNNPVRKNNIRRNKHRLTSKTRKLNKKHNSKSKKLKRTKNNKARTRKVKKQVGGFNVPESYNFSGAISTNDIIFQYLGRATKESSSGTGVDELRAFFIFTNRKPEEKPKNNTFKLCYYIVQDKKEDTSELSISVGTEFNTASYQYANNKDITHIKDNIFYNQKKREVTLANTDEARNLKIAFYKFFFDPLIYEDNNDFVQGLGAPTNEFTKNKKQFIYIEKKPEYTFIGNTMLILNFIEDGGGHQFKIKLSKLANFFSQNEYKVTLVELLQQIRKTTQDSGETVKREILLDLTKYINIDSIITNKIKLDEENIEILKVDVISFIFQNLTHIVKGDSEDDKSNNIYYLELSIKIRKIIVAGISQDGIPRPKFAGVPPIIKFTNTNTNTKTSFSRERSDAFSKSR